MVLVGVKEECLLNLISLLVCLIAAIQSNAMLLPCCRNLVNGEFLGEYLLSGLWEALTKQLGLLLTKQAVLFSPIYSGISSEKHCVGLEATDLRPNQQRHTQTQTHQRLAS